VMQLAGSITSTGTRGGFSGGRSRTGSIEQWFLRESSDRFWERSTPGFVIESPPEESGVVFLRAMSSRTSSYAWEYPQELLLRLACHALINRLPEESLAEICMAVGKAFYPDSGVGLGCGAANVAQSKLERAFVRRRGTPREGRKPTERTLLKHSLQGLAQFTLSSDQPTEDDIGPRTGRFRE